MPRARAARGIAVSRATLPVRLSWAVEVLAVEGGERILEIGCGSGLALDQICQRLDSGRATGLDRSATAIAAARSRNRAHLRSGKARLLEGTLAHAELDERFDKILAVNVNVFWLDPAQELEVVRRLLAPAGQLFLCYEAPSEAQALKAERASARHLLEAGFEVSEPLRMPQSPKLGLCIRARCRSRARRARPVEQLGALARARG